MHVGDISSCKLTRNGVIYLLDSLLSHAHHDVIAVSNLLVLSLSNVSMNVRPVFDQSSGDI
jgi:hypothetical protein